MNIISPFTLKTIFCHDATHFHVDHRQDIMTLHIGGHEVIVESERGSHLYSVWIDGREAGVFISPVALDALMRGVTGAC